MTESVSIQEYLEQHGTLTYTNVGVSMLPLLRQGKDLFILRRKGPDRCRKGDVVLFRRPPDSYVLHRVIEVRAQDYVILGDNCMSKEAGIADKDILGVMTGFVRGGKEHSVDEWGYRLYSFVWMHSISLRIFMKRTRNHLAKWVKRVLHEE